jgi:uncharacterized protein YPO0396
MKPEAPPLHEVFAHGQIRLASLSVYNWGSFCGLHTAAVDAQGTLITGDNGAGKSTLVDGLIALLLPQGKATFNIAAAQGDRADRSIVSYIRGSYGSQQEGVRTTVQSKRQGAVVSALRAHYVADDGAPFTLAGLLWIPNASNALADVKRLYFVARRDLRLEEVLELFGRGQARAVKQRYRSDERVTLFEHFTDYQESYRRALCMENENAPALLARALGLKKIDDLTALIREFVLEPSTVRESARKAVAEFADLVATHNELVDARRQQETLSPLPALEQELQAAESRRLELEAERDALPVYCAEQAERLWSARQQHIERQLKAVELTVTQLERAEKDTQAEAEARHAEYVQAGGGRIEELKKDRERTRAQLEEVTRAASRYQETVRALSLDDRLLEASYQANQEQARIAGRNFEQRRQQAQDRFAAAAAAQSECEQRLQALEAELKEVESRPDSAIDPAFQNLRDRMAESLGFARTELMFVGELIDVKDEASAWHGAIERALGGLRTTLAVPDDRFRLVTRWLNERHVGLHVRVQVVREAKLPARFRDDGFLRKLEWREHPYRDWLKQHLARFDLACVADTETLDATPFSMTQAGLIHRESGRFEKKDIKRVDDRSEWCLGFSNERRLALLRSGVRERKGAVEQARQDAVSARRAWNDIEGEWRRWQDLLSMRWDQIDLPRLRHRLKEIEESLQALEKADGDLALAQQRWDAAKTRLAKVREQLRDKSEELGAIRASLKAAEKGREHAHFAAQAGIDDAVRARLVRRVGVVPDEQLDGIGNVEAQHRNEIEEALTGVRNRLGTTRNRAVGIMSAYRSRDEWKTLTAEWGSDLADLPTYLERLRHIEREGLPALVEQFRERLNRHTTHSLAGIRSQINNELDDIRERIDTINAVLARTEFRQGTYLRLKAERDEYEHVRDFDRQLQAVMQATTSDDHEARFAGLRTVIAILEKAISPASAYTRESLRLLDPRYRLSFVAEDVDAASGQVCDVLASSSGKSGGEKEAFAGTIVAASLAYVLTPDGASRPVYCTVFLDEAFSNTAEAVSRRVLRVFRELNIHVNLITPFKNLNLARESARSLLIAERDQERHESRLCQVTWEEIDRRLAERAAAAAAGAAVLHAVKVESLS